MNVCVLMSTYNGEAFLEEQLKSIFQQEGVSVDLIVRDDGSSDATVDILKRWEKTHRLQWYSGSNMGWAMSFMHLLLNSPECDFYAFCDQDDIWESNKLLRALQILPRTDATPGCYISNLLYWREGVPIRKVFGDNIYFDKYTCLVQCPAYGCTMVFNKELVDLIKRNPPRSVNAHDFWTYQVSMLLGDVYYDNNAYILYRQHGNNQEGALKSRKEIWKRRLLKSVPRIFSQRVVENNAKELLRCYQESMTEETYEIVSLVARYRESFSSYLKLLFSSKYVMPTIEGTFWLKVKILLCRL